MSSIQRSLSTSVSLEVSPGYKATVSQNILSSKTLSEIEGTLPREPMSQSSLLSVPYVYSNILDEKMPVLDDDCASFSTTLDSAPSFIPSIPSISDVAESLHTGLSTSTLDPDAALNAALDIVSAAADGLPFEDDFTPDENYAILLPHPDVPGIVLTPPPEGDVDQPCRPYVDEHTFWLYVLPDPYLLYPPARTSSGHVLQPWEYEIVPGEYDDPDVQLDEISGQDLVEAEYESYDDPEPHPNGDSQVYLEAENVAPQFNRGTYLETIFEGAESCESLALPSSPSSSIATVQSTGTIPASSSSASIFVPAVPNKYAVPLKGILKKGTSFPDTAVTSRRRVFEPSALAASPSDWVLAPSSSTLSMASSSSESSVAASAIFNLAPSISGLSISAMDAAYVSRRHPRPVMVKAHLWTVVHKARAMADAEATRGTGSWVRVTTRPSTTKKHSDWEMVEDFIGAEWEVNVRRGLKARIGARIGQLCRRL
ncbi:hypothetical protein K488DRAFT_86152 [Vararia minispora EC-137]|uniref:Uncharacterized protein n=1 Tax=Vararia minispora EC-137 TaxID=1314806 RepID=A0ACB8QKJ9_9AGAM|nr:hypothetical protein K488DRAFT_86152 [Vararia minispora EC-137]